VAHHVRGGCRCNGTRSISMGTKCRLDAGTTKNGEGRVFPLTDDPACAAGKPIRGARAPEGEGRDLPVGLLSAGRASAWRRQAPETHRRVQ
jgi:hypothetical protein